MFFGILFTLPLVISGDTSEFYKWEEMTARYKTEASQEWLINIRPMESLNRQEQIVAVNKYVNNSMKYVEDPDNWGQEDYWATPNEALAKGAGDCEDFAIMKYYSLKHLGFKTEELRITTVTYKNILHTVLVVDGYVLDNQIDKIRSLENVNYYTPIYSINEDNWWGN